MRAIQLRAASRIAFAIILIASLVLGVVAEAGYALADDSLEEAQAQVSELQAKVEATSAEYDRAVAKREELQQRVDDARARIEELNREMPDQEERAAQSVRAIYRLQQDGAGLLEAVLSSSDIRELIDRFQYLESIHRRNVSEVERLTQMRDELVSTKQSLDEDLAQIDEEVSRAERSLAQAQAAREEASQKAVALAQAQAEAQAAAEAEAKAKEEAAKSGSAGVDSQNAQRETSEEQQAPSGSVSSDQVDWSSDKAAFVAQWTPRIDAYLAGSPMAGTGSIFAEAAWDYGVDPRWSPAISAVESSKGAACFRPHNAWGWGSSSWSSWEEAIQAHVRGLARGYGSTLTYGAALKYCPPNAGFWYNRVLAEMNSI